MYTLCLLKAAWSCNLQRKLVSLIVVSVSKSTGSRHRIICLYLAVPVAMKCRNLHVIEGEVRDVISIELTALQFVLLSKIMHFAGFLCRTFTSIIIILLSYNTWK